LFFIHPSFLKLGNVFLASLAVGDRIAVDESCGELSLKETDDMLGRHVDGDDAVITEAP
jgi:hypothetical protein